MNIRFLFSLLILIAGLECRVAQGQQPATEAQPIVRLRTTIDLSRDFHFDPISIFVFANSRSSHFNPVQGLLLVQQKDSWGLLDLTTGEMQRTFASLKGMPILSPSTQRLLILDKKSAQLVSTKTGEKLCELKFPSGQMGNVEWSPDEHSLLFVTHHDSIGALIRRKEKTTAHVYMSEDCNLRFTLEIKSSYGTAAFSPDSKTILTTSAGEDAKLWDTLSGRLTATLRRSSRSIYAGSWGTFSPDGRFVAVTSYDEGITLWNVANGNLHVPVAENSLGEDEYRFLGFSPDGKLIAIYREHLAGLLKTQTSIELHDTETGQRKVVLQGRNMRDGAHQFAWSSNGKILVTAGGSKQYNGKIWDVDTGRLVATFPMIAKESRMPFDIGYKDLDVVSLHPSLPLLTVANNNFVRLLNAANGEVLQTLNNVSKPAKWTADGRYLITNRKDGKVIQIWELVGGLGD